MPFVSFVVHNPMNLTEHFNARRARRANGGTGRATIGIADTAVLTSRQVALVLGLSKDTVTSIERRALKKVKHQLEGTWRLMAHECGH